LIYVAFAAILLTAVAWQAHQHRRRDAAARQALRNTGSTIEGPVGRHPHIDTDWCIGCGACVAACPERDVLAVIGGKAALVNGAKCIGHELCADACPVGAIEIVMAPPSMTADLPVLSADLESTVPNLFVVGELGGLALIKNAVNQGRDCVDHIARRLPDLRRRSPPGAPPPLDLAVVGAGPGGLSASLRAVERGLSFVTLEAEGLGGTVAKYPRQKLVLTSPVEFPLHGTLQKREIRKESLLAFWEQAAAKAGDRIRTGERVEEIRPDGAGCLALVTSRATYRALTVVLAIGRRGAPRKLDVPGEELPHVMYSLLDAEAYRGKRILVVGGGDSAVEAAMGLAQQPGNRVVLSYRKEAFARLKARNEQRVREQTKRRAVEVIFGSQPVEIRSRSVTLEVAGSRREVAADYVWVLIGGTPPRAFLERAGVRLGRQELSEAVRAETAVASDAGQLPSGRPGGPAPAEPAAR
jgi:thioredoxin reductase/NAD-dependent dihydropyrimidine dehydrogenase PreA subunit